MMLNDRRNWRDAEASITERTTSTLAMMIARGTTAVRSYAQVDVNCRLERVSGRRMATAGYLISLAGGTVNLALMLLPAAQRLPWAVALLPVVTFGVALAFPVLTLAMLDLFPANRGAASSVQSFVSLVANAAIAGALAPAVAFSLPSLAATSLLLTLIGYLLWRRHLTMTAIEPGCPPDPENYEPTDEL